MTNKTEWEMNFDVNVIKNKDGTFDVYMAHDGSSGSHYPNVQNISQIGEYLAEDIQIYDDMMPSNE